MDNERKFWLCLIEPNKLKYSWDVELNDRREEDEPPYSHDYGVYQFPIILTFHPEEDEYPTLSIEQWFLDNDMKRQEEAAQ